MKVLILTPDIYTRGGIARYTAALASALGDLIGTRNVDVQPLLDGAGLRETFGKFRVLNPVTGRLTLSSKFRFAGRALAMGGRKHNLTVCTHIGLSPVAALARLLFGTPFWVTCHGSEAWSQFAADERCALRLADLILPVSRFTAKTISKTNGIPQSKMRILSNAIPDEFAAMLMSPNGASGSGVSRNGKEKLMLSVGTVSRTSAYKGYDTVIKALPQVRKAIPNIRYLIAGAGDDIDRLKGVAREAGVRDQVEFKGSVPDAELAACYRACDVFVLPSRVRKKRQWEGEGFGRVYVEAALAGKPVVGSAEGGAAEAVLDGKTGLLVDPTSVSEVVEALSMLLRNPSLAARMGSEGRRWAKELFTVPAIRCSLEQMLGAYAGENP